MIEGGRDLGIIEYVPTNIFGEQMDGDQRNWRFKRGYKSENWVF